jgi:hypothetical protein
MLSPCHGSTAQITVLIHTRYMLSPYSTAQIAVLIHTRYMLSPCSTAQMNTFVLVNTLVIHNEYILDNTLLILLLSAGQQPICRHPLPRQGIVDLLHTIFKTFHAIRGGDADLKKQLKHLDTLLVSSSQPPDDMDDMGEASMMIGQIQEFNRRRNAARHKQITDLLPRSVAEIFAVYAYSDVSAANMNTFLGLSSSKQFDPRDLAEFTCVQTMESRIMRIIFPEGHRTKDLTRIKDGEKLVLHYIPYVEIVKRILRNKMLAGHIYTKYEVEMSPRNPANRGMGRANSGTWFQGA